MAVCLMLVMVLSTGMAVSAAQLTSKAEDTITISGIETDDSGHGIGTLNAYQVINVNVSDNNQPQAPVYKWNDAVAEWVSRNFRSYIDINNSNAVTDAFLDLSDQSDDEAQAELKTFVDRLANAIRYTEGEDEDTAITINPAYKIDLSQQIILVHDHALALRDGRQAMVGLAADGLLLHLFPWHNPLGLQLSPEALDVDVLIHSSRQDARRLLQILVEGDDVAPGSQIHRHHGVQAAGGIAAQLGHLLLGDRDPAFRHGELDAGVGVRAHRLLLIPDTRRRASLGLSLLRCTFPSVLL